MSFLIGKRLSNTMPRQAGCHRDFLFGSRLTNSLHLGHPYLAGYRHAASEAESSRVFREEANQNCGILRLPPELRNPINRAVFAESSHPREHTAVSIVERRVHGRSLRQAFRRSRGLLQRCRTLRFESQKLF